MQQIQSRHNAQLKRWKKIQTKKGRKQHLQFWIEGEHLIQEVMQEKWKVEQYVFSEDYVQHQRSLFRQIVEQEGNDHIYVLPTEWFNQLCETKTPQGIAAVVQIPAVQFSADKLSQWQFILLIDAVQDPGNLGTLIRTADAAGVDAVLVGEGSADLFAGKTIRATQGSLFHLPVQEAHIDQLVHQIPRSADEWRILGTDVAGQAVDIFKLVHSPSFSSRQKVALIVGNEGQGVRKELLDQTDFNVHIPLRGRAESLNVSVATGIILYQIQSRLH